MIMYTPQYFFIENIKNSIIYNEANKYYINNNNNDVMTEISKYNISYLNENILFFFTNNIMTYEINKLNSFFISSLFGNKIRFRMVGRGYYLYYKKNVLYFRLGYSHIVPLILPMGLIIAKKKKRKKKFYVLVSNYINLLKYWSKGIRSLRGPNLYSKRRKGFSLYNDFIPRGINSVSKF